METIRRRDGVKRMRFLWGRARRVTGRLGPTQAAENIPAFRVLAPAAPTGGDSTPYVFRMPAVYPFAALTYHLSPGATVDLSDVVAPPYDVLDVPGKQRLIDKDADNIVSVDLPHIPAKSLGAPEVYQQAALTLQRMIAEAVLHKLDAPAMFVYRQTFTFGGTQHKRTGMACTLDIKPFGSAPGGGILPHEETFSGPKEDRMALMKATATQLSPIFGLHQDETGKGAKLLRDIAATRSPEMQATTDDGTLHEVWLVRDPIAQQKYSECLRGEDVFIADGHHRYTTALNYLRDLEKTTSVPPDHPARCCMFVLISMSDPGTVIGPTHRVLGGMSNYSWPEFMRQSAATLLFEPIAGDLSALESALLKVEGMGSPRVGLWDIAGRSGCIVIPGSKDHLAARFPNKVAAWRALDVAMCQYTIVEEICQQKLNAGQPVKWAFPHSIAEVEAISRGEETGAGGGSGFTAQLAVILRPTPLQAVREVSRAGELMPQKSTFFVPKLATGLFMNPVG